MFGKSLTVLMGLILTPGFASMSDSSSSGALLLLRPSAGIPVSFRQVEEHRRLDNGTFAVEFTVTAQQYRDAAGRVRIESETRAKAGNSSSVVIADPVAGFQIFLMDAEKLAIRWPIPVSSEGRLFFADAADGQDVPHKWKTTTEDKGEHLIEGYEFKGTRIITSAEDDKALATTFDQWYSEKLKLIGAIDRSGPYRAYTVRIEQLKLGEPDSKLF